VGKGLEALFNDVEINTHETKPMQTRKQEGILFLTSMKKTEFKNSQKGIFRRKNRRACGGP
jgi:hypothetical protein